MRGLHLVVPALVTAFVFGCGTAIEAPSAGVGKGDDEAPSLTLDRSSWLHSQQLYSGVQAVQVSGTVTIVSATDDAGTPLALVGDRLLKVWVTDNGKEIAAVAAQVNRFVYEGAFGPGPRRIELHASLAPEAESYRIKIAIESTVQELDVSVLNPGMCAASGVECQAAEACQVDSSSRYVTCAVEATEGTPCTSPTVFQQCTPRDARGNFLPCGSGWRSCPLGDQRWSACVPFSTDDKATLQGYFPSFPDLFSCTADGAV